MMQTSAVGLEELLGSSQAGGTATARPVSAENKIRFEQLLGEGSSGGVLSQITNTIQSVENKFNESHVNIVKNLKSFEETGGAVALMMASHQGANNSVMVQLCGTVSKKCADNAEQIYKQQ